jgi:hypothetical protein
MKSGYAQLEYALAHAAPLEKRGGLWVVSPGHDIHVGALPGIFAPDNTPVHLSAPEELPPCWVTAETTEEMHDLLREYHERIEAPPDESEVKKQLGHEEEHNLAAGWLGAHFTRLAMRVTENPAENVTAWDLTLLPYGLSTTKLGAAVLDASAAQRSLVDLRQIYRAGYAGVEDVAQRAAQQGLPVPPSDNHLERDTAQTLASIMDSGFMASY